MPTVARLGIGEANCKHTMPPVPLPQRQCYSAQRGLSLLYVSPRWRPVVQNATRDSPSLTSTSFGSQSRDIKRTISVSMVITELLSAPSSYYGPLDVVSVPGGWEATGQGVGLHGLRADRYTTFPRSHGPHGKLWLDSAVRMIKTSQHWYATPLCRAQGAETHSAHTPSPPTQAKAVA